jgi:hypothetical protein
MDTTKINAALRQYAEDLKYLPPDTLPLQTSRPFMQPGSMEFAIREAMKLPHALQLWVANRAVTYWMSFKSWSPEEWDYAAIIDLLRYRNGKIQAR